MMVSSSIMLALNDIQLVCEINVVLTIPLCFHDYNGDNDNGTKVSTWISQSIAPARVLCKVVTKFTLTYLCYRNRPTLTKRFISTDFYQTRLGAKKDSVTKKCILKYRLYKYNIPKK